MLNHECGGGFVAGRIDVGGADRERRHPDRTTPTCTHEHAGSRVCGWPEDRALIGRHVAPPVAAGDLAVAVIGLAAWAAAGRRGIVVRGTPAG